MDEKYLKLKKLEEHIHNNWIKMPQKNKSLDDLLQEKYNITEDELVKMLKEHYPEKLI